jgi:hypothetical protein
MLRVNVYETDNSVDLGGSSKYSNEKKLLKTEVEKGFMTTVFDHE